MERVISTSFVSEDSARSLAGLKKQLLIFSVFNFFLVASTGLLMRSYPLLENAPFDYKYLLHGHSHFAFGGWVMPVLTWMVMQYFPGITRRIAFRHWRNIILILLISAYGMLASFPFQGYAFVSICFSTLSIIGSFYLAIVLWKASGSVKMETPIRFLRAGLIYLALSALGPFATAPLFALGKSGTPLYFDVIYFFLHFQYNGWFSFAMLAVWYAVKGNNMSTVNGRKAFLYFNLACIPTYFLSILWHNPHPVFYVVGATGAIIQLAGLYHLLKDLRMAGKRFSFIEWMVVISLASFILKNILQLASAFPSIADLAYGQRNFIIGYLHLVLLGFISLGAVASILYAKPSLTTVKVKSAILIFLVSFFATELLMVIQAGGSLWNYALPGFARLMFIMSCLFPLSILFFFVQLLRNTGVNYSGGKEILS